MTDGGAMKAGVSDYEAMFKQHVKSNLVLHSRMRDMDSLKHKKMQELERDKARFQMQYSKYNPKGRLPNISSPRNKSDTKSAVPKPVFVVCKNLPYSFRTWNNLTDVSDGSIDLYKTDVLQTEEAPLSFQKPAEESLYQTQEKRCSTSIGLLDDLPPRPRRRSHTMPEIEACRQKLMQKLKLSVKKVDSDGDINTTENTPNENANDRQNTIALPEIIVTCKSPVLVSNTDSCTENLRSRPRRNTDLSDTIVSKHSAHSRRLSVDNTQVLKQKNNQSSLPKDCLDTNVEKTNNLLEAPSIESRRSSFSGRLNSGQLLNRRQSCTEQISDNQSPLLERRRCNTMENPSRPNMQRRNSRKYTIGLEGYTGFRRGSLFEKLLSASCSALDGMDSDGNEIGDMNKCRYIRIKGENIEGSREDVSLEDLDFRHTASPVTEESETANVAIS